MLIRAELFQPGLQLVQPEFFNQMTTLHALMMVFGAVMPAFVGLRQLADTADDRSTGHGPAAHEQLVLLDPALRLAMLSVHPVHARRRAATGWTLYPPLVLQTGAALPLAIFSIHLMGLSSLMGGINIIVTIMNMRAPGMTLMSMPMFVWTWLITAYLLIAVMPVLAGVHDHAADGPFLRHQFL